ncbi:MAG TPA: MFS transporter [Ktedonobacterales bacterium]
MAGRTERAEADTGRPPVPKHLRPRRAFSSLRQRNFRLYWLGQTVSVMGTWMQSIGQTWLVLQLTHSAWQIGVVGAIDLLPTLTFSLLAGVMADRWPKRAVLLATQSVALAQAVILWALVASHSIQLWHVYALAFLLGLVRCLSAPVRQAFMIEMAGRDDLPNAIALNASAANLARFAGPGLAGLIIAASNVGTLFLLNALSYLAVIGGLALINIRELHIREAHHSDRHSAWRSLREGLAYVWRSPLILLPIVVVGLALLFGSNFSVLLPLFATDVLKAGPRGFGFLAAAFGVGSLLAALWLASAKQSPTIRRILIAGAAFGMLGIAFSSSRLLPLSLVLMVGTGFAEESLVTMATTGIQLATPDHLQGRVMSVNVLFLDGTVPPGYLATGALASQFGAPAAMLTGAVGVLAVVGAGWLWWRVAKARGMIPEKSA